MADNGDTESRDERASSDPKEIPKQSAIKIDFNTSQCASFVSQRSSSLETFGSVTSLSPTNSSDGNTAESQTHRNAVSDDSTLDSSNMSASRDSGNDSAAVNGEEPGADSQAWMYNNESLPSSMLHPAHRSTPVKDCEYLSTVSEEGGGDTTHDEEAEDGEGGTQEQTIYFPGDLSTPILGYETMESRSRFTVFKIHVQKAATESGGWFVFRRYSDFLHLNERLKYQFPGFRLSLPPKRWFRDNFDPNFLEDRVLGLQAFLDNITGHKDILNSAAVRAFLCIDDPPGPHDSLEESRALCETLEETVYSLKQDLQEKESEVTLLKEELELYKSQVELLSNQLRVVTGSAPAKGEETMSASSTRHSLAECDRDAPPSPDTGPAKAGDKPQAQEKQCSEETSPITK